MTIRAKKKFVKRRIRVFVPLLFLLSTVASGAFQDVSKSSSETTAAAISQGPAQGDPPRNSPGESDKNAVPDKAKQPSPPFEDFLTSEKIDADKAVDFPVDI